MREEGQSGRGSLRVEEKRPQCLQVGQCLLDTADILPGVLLEAAQPLHQVENRVLVAAGGAADLLP